MISVVRVDDHPVVIEGLRKVLAIAGDIDVTGEAHDAAAAIEQARLLDPDVILLDLRMPGASGVQAVRRMREQQVRSAVIILTSYGDQAYVRQALEAGADGYLLKSTRPEDLIAAIRQAALGKVPLSPAITRRLISTAVGAAKHREQAQNALARLTDRERAIAIVVGEHVGRMGEQDGRHAAFLGA